MLNKCSLILSKENLCNNCPSHVRGICCYGMVYLEGYLFTLTNHPCKYLNKKTGRCKIYNKRKVINPNCVSLEEMYLIGSFPKDCPYIKEDKQYLNRNDIRHDINDIKNERIDFYEIFEEYNECNNKPHKEVSEYETLRTHICPKCHSNNLIEGWDTKFSIMFFRYECEKCHHKWNNLNKQIKFTITLIKRNGNDKKI